jgi:DNA invertase Pin-like site-specific DNA recombinase
MFSFVLAVAEFERSLIRERVNSGLRAARERGVRRGHPAGLEKRSGEIVALKVQGTGLGAIARQLKMPPSSVHKALQLAA